MKSSPWEILRVGKNFSIVFRLLVFIHLIINSEVLVFHEITNGPFNPDDTVWASWAPDENDVQEVSRYMELIACSIKESHKYG